MHEKCSPLHNRMLWLLQRLKVNEKGEYKNDDHSHDYTQICMDNLYLSHKICIITKQKQQLWPPTYIAGPTRKNRGITDIIEQQKKSGKDEVLARGTLKIAVDIDNVLAISLYDNKPFYYLSTIDSIIEELMIKSYKLWDPQTGANVFKEIFRLNVIDFYNKVMNMVDRADQLRNQYRIDHTWWRNNKWWWSIFIWLLGVVTVNSYVIYKRICGQHEVTPMSHFEFRMSIALDLMESKEPRERNSAPQTQKKRAGTTETLHRLRSEQASKKPKQAPSVTKKRLEAMEAWDGALHVFEALDNSGDTFQRCRMCKQEKVKVWKKKKKVYEFEPKIVRATLACTTCNNKHGNIAYFCGPVCYHAWPAHIPQEE